MEGKKYDLEDRTLEFAKRILKMVRALPKNSINEYYSSQVVRSSGSIGANYREANDALGKKDFIHRIKISRKESKETTYSEINCGI
jgi:four helix bundle protein